MKQVAALRCRVQLGALLRALSRRLTAPETRHAAQHRPKLLATMGLPKALGPTRWGLIGAARDL
eukprot:11493266-Alexandrium_andersonii.AAC.1